MDIRRRHLIYMAIVGVALGATASTMLGTGGSVIETTEDGEVLVEYQEIPPWKLLWNMLRYNDPEGPMSSTSQDEPVAIPVKVPGKIRQMCDRCSVAVAAFEIRTKEGSIFLCAHHTNKHAEYIKKEQHGLRELG